MKAIICSAPGTMILTGIPDAVRQEGHTLVKIRRIGICGTDMHAYGGVQPFFNYPRILGHELAGEIAEPDPDSQAVTGDLVTILPYLSCGHCTACAAGKPNCCVTMQVLGVHQDGGMVEYLSVPTPYVVPANGLDVDSLALVEPLSISSHAVSRAAVMTGEYVLVAGAGPIGQGVIDFAILAGARVIVLDVDNARLQFCRQQPGIHAVIDGRDPDLPAQLLRITNGSMPAVVVDATGNLQAIQNGFQYLAHAGRYILVGLQKEGITFSHPEFHKREATLMSSRNANFADFAFVMDTIRQEKLQASTYITERIAFDDTPGYFESLAGKRSFSIKTIIEL
ncbi:MAG: zinc-binding alcohol dehydrogenase family protein [Chitinophagaceae bacterium]|nr:MAG: zinc-binding alcohol dehydrogenase family protein [Chitinophagaceae bacterium]